MEQAINDYRNSLKDYQIASKKYVKASAELRKFRHAVRLAEDQLRIMRAEILDDQLRDL